MNMKWDTIHALEQLCRAAGVGGMMEASETAAKLLRPYVDELRIDVLGNVIGIKQCGKPDAPKLMLEAHIDEIGMIVTGYDEAGFVKVSNCGGIDARVVTATEVTVWGKRPLTGVFCSTPPHLSEGEKEISALTDMGVDVGLDVQSLKEQIPLGSRVSFVPHFYRVGADKVSCKALDDRAGVAAVLYAAQLLAEQELSVDMVYCFAVQEEVGSKGSKTAAFGVSPEMAIAVDVSFAHTPDAERARCGDMGRGPMIGWSPCLDLKLTQVLKQLAEEHHIDYQVEVMGGSTGTDADAIMSSKTGVRTGLLSIPLKFMHTPVEMIQLQDLENTGRLMALFAENIEMAEQ